MIKFPPTDKELKQIKAAIRDLEFAENPKLLESLGLKGFSYRYGVYANKYIVIKPQDGRNKDFRSKYRIPTIVIRIKNNLNSYFDYTYPCYYVIQPKAKIDAHSRKVAFEFFCNKGCYNNIDLHDENVGIYNGQPVIFDW